MDLAQTLIRTTVRSFYSVKHILIVDALIVHSVLTTEDLAFLLGQQMAEVRRLLHPLKQARMVSSQSRQETRDGYQKAISREYYYILLHPAIDAIKYKIWQLQTKVQELYKPTEERKDWKCTRCNSEWTDLEIVNNIGPEGILCHKCGALLDRAANAQGDESSMAGHEKQALLQKQIEKMVRLMQQIDSQQVPENDFETAWDRKKNVQREQGLGTRAPMVPVSSIRMAAGGSGKPEQTDASRIQVNISNTDELNEAEKRAAEAERTRLAAQNMLPVWHSQSAIGMGIGVKVEGAGADALIKPDPDAADQKGGIASADDEMDKIYAEMARERARDAEKAALAAQDAEDNDEYEDEDEFEDVPSTGVGTPNIGGTPLPSSQIAPNGIKRERDTDSGTSTSVNTPTDTPNAKRVKFEAGAEQSAVTVKKEEEDSDEDEEEFEDV